MLGTKKDTKGSVSNKVKSKRRKSKRRDILGTLIYSSESRLSFE